MTLFIILIGLLLSGIYCLEEMAYSPLINDYNPHLESWPQTPSYAPTPGDFHRERTPSVYSPFSSGPFRERSTPLPESQRRQGSLTREADWDDGSILYVIEWKVTLNNRFLSRDTEQDLDLRPRLYWDRITEEADKIVHRKKNRNQRVRLDDTTVVVSVNDRQHRDLTKRFEHTDVDWTVIERQLLSWRMLYHKGKELRLSITINYLEDNSLSASRTDKRGSSATKRMLGEREAQMDAERSTGQPTAWRDVYRVMRCPGRPCHHNGQFCWLDPVGKKHYKLLAHHLRSLVRHVEDGNVLETHDDVPYEIRERLYAEDEKQRESTQKPANVSMTGSVPPINIHVLPSQSSQRSMASSSDSGTHTSRMDEANSLDIPGLFEEAVDNYTDWQLSRVSSEFFKDNIRKARDITLENCLDLKQVHCEIEPNFYIDQGVKIGVARRFVRDISLWAKNCAYNKDSDDSV